MVEHHTGIRTNHLWPTCGDGEVRVMILGTYHMANPGLDEVSIEADDALSTPRQTELENLADRLVEWAPNRVRVKRSVKDQGKLSAEYVS